ERARIFGVLGDPVDHSLSPAMQNAAFVATQLPHLYLRFRVPARALRGALGEARQLAMGGLNLTLPLKEAVLPLLDALTPRAERRAEHLPRLGPTPITLAPLEALAQGRALEPASLVVNTTPLGLLGAPLRLRAEASPRACLFVDLVYAAEPTPFLARAARAGRSTLDGTSLLLQQGALAFELWTRRRAPRAAMARALRAAGLGAHATPLTRRGAAATVSSRRPPRS